MKLAPIGLGCYFAVSINDFGAQMVALLGFPPEAVPIIFVISVIIDIPATLMNFTGNVVCAMLVNRFVEGKDWLRGRANAGAEAKANMH